MLYKIIRGPGGVLQGYRAFVSAGVATGPRGQNGNDAIVHHGSNAAFPRPAIVGPVIWVGDVLPDEIINGTDLWVNTA